ncbi:MAG: NAD+ synthase [Halothiobacillaceae bacterium]
MRIALAQINLTVGDIAGNTLKIIDWTRRAQAEFQADVVLFPELTLTGYPPEDLVKRPDFMAAVEAALARLLRELPQGISVVLGLPEKTPHGRYNAAMVLRDGSMIARYYKQHLPNDGVFDELRYFTAGVESVVCENGLALLICEDIWHADPVNQAKAADARAVLVLNASPYQYDKPGSREQVLRARAGESGLPMVYVNLVGGQDELVFDGGSMVMDASGAVVHRLPMFQEALGCVELDAQGRWSVVDALQSERLDETAAIYQALVLAVRDYAHKNSFKGALLGLSGGIDSALTLALAVDALGAEQVEAVLLPSRYTSDMSNEDALAQAKIMAVRHYVVPIEPSYLAFRQMLAPVLAGEPVGATDENLQARSRGVVLMALSNASGKLLLTTGNKSEMAVGYATLYGDMAGGFAPLKDVPKMLVYRLANYRNTQSAVIPERVITRPPSAELRPEQKDEDSLPPYPVLDAILAAYIERMEGVEQIVAQGFDEALVRRIIRMVDLAEYKRRQAPPGVKITARAFGRERRLPITNGFRR